MPLRNLASKLALCFALVGTACAAAPPTDAQRVTVSLEKVDCADCGDEIVQDLRNRPGVYEARFDRKKAEIFVIASPSFDVLTIVRQLAAAEGFSAILGEGKGTYLERATFPEGADAKTVVEDGSDLPALEAILAKDKPTVVDFSAIWCRPCRKVDEHMAEVFKGRNDIAYRRLDISDWDSPLAKHYLTEVSQLPFVIVFDAKSKEVDRIMGLDLARLDQAISKAAGK